MLIADILADKSFPDSLRRVAKEGCGVKFPGVFTANLVNVYFYILVYSAVLTRFFA